MKASELAAALVAVEENAELLKGVKGEPGLEGPQGERGPEGPKGRTGDKGPQGDRGPVGPEGKQGPKGDTGASGPKGQAGRDGTDGRDGNDGQKGPKGDMGPQGPRGPAGKTNGVLFHGSTGGGGSIGTLRQAAGVPTGAPSATELPIAFDSTAVSGGLYIWDGASWVYASPIPPVLTPDP